MHKYFTQPIPILDDARLRRRGSRAHPIDLSSLQNKEVAVDARAHGIRGENYYHRKDNPPYFHSAPGSIPELYVRESVLVRLLAVNESLKKEGYELFLFDAYRPLQVQNYFHDEWVPKYLREKFPNWSEEQILEEVGNYWAKGARSIHEIDPLSPSPHATGAVVDVSIINTRLGGEIFMGSHFDEVSSISHTDHFERALGERVLTMSEEIALAHRRLLYWSMVEQGFVGNPNEWWHFGIGDQMSAKISGEESAVYSVLIV